MPRISGRRFLTLVAITVALLSPARGSAGDSTPKAPPKAAGWAPPALASKVAERGTLVVHVFVPLCDNDQIVCGSTRAGDPDDLDHNLYWGAIFGQRRFFSRKASKFTRLALDSTPSGPRLERAVFSRSFDGEPWGRSKPIELVVVLDAYRGDAIDKAVDAFFTEADDGGSVTFGEGDAARTEKVDVVGYAGHNRMMDGKKPPARSTSKAEGIPSFVMACRSSSYFEAPLAERGSKTLLMTRDLMAPEGYVVHAIVSSLAVNASVGDVRAQTVQAYATWQKVETAVASSIFAKP